MQHRTHTFSHRTRALMLVMVLLGIILPGAALHAGIQYSVGIESLVGRTSTNGTLSGMQVRVGKFTGGFAPSLANYNQWLANFVPLMPAGALSADSTAFITAAAPNTGPWKMMNRTLAVNFGQDPAGFAEGDAICIWISNSTASTATTQVALLTDACWIYQTAAENPQPSVTFVLRSEAPTLVAGTSFNDSFADASGEPGLLLVTAAIPVPEIAVEQPVGSDVPSGGSRSFGSVSVGSSASLQFTIKNTGNADLTGLTITKDGSDAAEFSLTANPVAPVSGPSGSATFTVEFAPTSTGPKAAVIHIASNDLDESPFDITLGGTGTTTLVQDWRQLYFGTLSNSGNAADTFDFDNDGLVNLLEWACGLNPTTTSTLSVLIVRNGANLELTYTRSTAAVNAGAVFSVEWSDTLLVAGWNTTDVTQLILSDDGIFQQVKATLPSGSGGRRFVRLRVNAPP